ncbi:hypothetical protein F2Q69_00033725 [Brassica cretica]|uniref:Uncharacterized protein n=1 Tax=Brassica cretica TaxID=69181 RepID=A0A8S9SL65_BRACR|nr:hypothetical protein F2Q69_00033725 [Brassica cretica]
MFRLHFACMSPYQVLKYHMEFLETFGCNWSPKEVFKVIIGRAPYRSDQSGTIPSSHSDLSIRATLPERRAEVTRVLITRKRENESGATSRSDTARSLPKHGATTRSDERRSLRVRLVSARTYDFSRAFWSFHDALFYFLNLCFNTL